MQRLSRSFRCTNIRNWSCNFFPTVNWTRTSRDATTSGRGYSNVTLLVRLMSMNVIYTGRNDPVLGKFPKGHCYKRDRLSFFFFSRGVLKRSRQHTNRVLLITALFLAKVCIVHLMQMEPTLGNRRYVVIDPFNHFRVPSGWAAGTRGSISNVGLRCVCCYERNEILACDHSGDAAGRFHLYSLNE